MIRKLNN